MTAGQQWVAAADILTELRKKDEPGSDPPDDSLVDMFRDGVTSACREPEASLEEVGATVYLSDLDRFRPL